MLVIRSVEGMKASLIVELDFPLPAYNIKDLVAYPNPDNDKQYFESEVVSIEMIRSKVNGGDIINTITYILDNGDVVTEDEIEYKCEPFRVSEE